MKQQESPLFVYPDPITGPDTLSGAAFLYFRGRLIATLPPMVITTDAFELMAIVEKRKPTWAVQYSEVLNAWRYQHERSQEMLSLLEPLQKSGVFQLSWMVYPCDSAALEHSAQLVTRSRLGMKSVAKLIDPINAAGELVRHIMLDKYLEVGQDVGHLYEYCDQLFRRESLETLLTKAYLLRLPMITSGQSSSVSVMLTNERLASLFSRLGPRRRGARENNVEDDVVAWEIFRQILSEYLDPLDPRRVELIARLLESREEEIERLKRKCLVLSAQLRDIPSQDRLVSTVQTLVQVHAQKEIGDVLELDQRGMSGFLSSLSTDAAAWTSVLMLLSGVIGGQDAMIVSGAIAGVSMVGAGVGRSRREKSGTLKRSDYALVYRAASGQA